MMIDLYNLRLSFHRALLFSVIPPLRFIFVQVVGKKMVLTIYTDRKLNEKEKDIYYSMSGEMSGDFPEINDALCEVNFIVSNKSLEDLPKEGELFFARFEECKENI